jgi:hypothetical protein
MRNDKRNTFKSSERVGIAVLARDSLVYPAGIAEYRCVSLIADVQRYERVKIVDLVMGGLSLLSYSVYFVEPRSITKSYSGALVMWQLIAVGSSLRLSDMKSHWRLADKVTNSL